MSFLDKIKSGAQRLMAGRHGVDELSMAMLIVAMTLSIIDSFIRTGVLSIISTALYVLSILRIFSKNHEKRWQENQKYLEIWHKSTSGIKQFFNRLKNSRKYRYFKCPNCGSRLRLPRKVGSVTVTCGKCKHAFKQKA